MRMRAVAVNCIILFLMATGCASDPAALNLSSASPVFSEKPSSSFEEKKKTGKEKLEFSGEVYEVRPGDTLYELFGSENWKVVARINRVSPRALMPGMKLFIPQDMEAAKNAYFPLPRQTRSEAQIVVDLEKQALGRYRDGELQSWYPVASGREGHVTPTGLFRVLRKERDYTSRTHPKPDGGASMPYAMRFYGGYWIHAGSLPGKPASHGCIRLIREDAKELFENSQVGDEVLIRSRID